MFARISLRGLIAYIHDIFMAAASFVLAFYLRLGDVFYYYDPDLLLTSTVIFTVIAAGVFWFMGLYRGVWRYASLDDLLLILRSATLALFVFILVMFVWARLEDLPRSIPLINWFILLALLGGPRFLYRIAKDRRIDFRAQMGASTRVPVLLVGAGDGAELFIHGTAHDENYEVVGIVAEKRSRVGQKIRGVSVLGATSELAAVVQGLARKSQRPQRLILTKDDMDGGTIRGLFDEAHRMGMTLARIPRLTEFKSGLGDKVEMRPVDVEDLLGRPQTRLDHDAMEALIKGKRVLVTGAGGSIGSELVRQVSDFGPETLTLLEMSEFALYQIDMEISTRHPALARRAVLADVRDKDRLNRVFTETAPHVVFHAAALKHVPLVEMNPIEGVMTNVIGGANVADMCVAHGAEVMVQISTDKAVNPSSVMGATKRIAERYCQALDLQRDQDHATRFVTVRFGNVLGSTGSVVPLFQRQLAAGGPITVTHPDMERYFMTIREAVELVLQASALGYKGGEESGKIYVLDMGEPVRILDLAKQMIRLAGLQPDRDVKIDFTGLRPGEKLREVVFHDAEVLVPTGCAGILLAAPRAADAQEMADAVADIAAICREGDVRRTIDKVQSLVPEFQGDRENEI